MEDPTCLCLASSNPLQGVTDLDKTRAKACKVWTEQLQKHVKMDERERDLMVVILYPYKDKDRREKTHTKQTRNASKKKHEGFTFCVMYKAPKVLILIKPLAENISCCEVKIHQRSLQVPFFTNVIFPLAQQHISLLGF